MLVKLYKNKAIHLEDKCQIKKKKLKYMHTYQEIIGYSVRINYELFFD